MGYSKTKAKLASPEILDTFKEADFAYVNQTKDKVAEDLHYYRMFLAFSKAYKILGVDTASIKYKIGWIKASRHKNYSSVILNLFLEYITLFGIAKLPTAIKALQVSVNDVYPAHSRHDWKALQKALAKYWKILDFSYKHRKVLPVQF